MAKSQRDSLACLQVVQQHVKDQLGVASFVDDDHPVTYKLQAARRREHGHVESDLELVIKQLLRAIQAAEAENCQAVLEILKEELECEVDTSLR